MRRVRAGLGTGIGCIGQLRQSSWKPRGTAAALACLAAVIAGCSSPSGSSGSAGATEQLTVAAPPGIEAAPLAVAARSGLFGQHGLKVTVIHAPSVAAAYEDLKHHTADIAAGDYSSFFYAQSLTHQLALVADAYDAASGTMQVLTLPNSPIRSPQQLSGTTVATPPSEVAPYQTAFPYNIETLATQSVLQSDGINPASVHWKQMPVSQMVNALADHQVSAIVATDPQITQAETQLGAVELLDSCSGVTADLPLAGYFSTSAFARAHPAALTEFRDAILAAQADAGNRSTVQSVLRGEHMTAVETAMFNIGQYPTFVSVGQIQGVADLMYTSGMIPSPVSVRSMLVK